MYGYKMRYVTCGCNVIRYAMLEATTQNMRLYTTYVPNNCDKADHLARGTDAWHVAHMTHTNLGGAEHDFAMSGRWPF